MEVTSVRTGERRYAVIARPERWPAITMDPAPGFDPRLPHDLVHYAIEREHGIELGVFGQLAAGGNLRTFRRLDAMPDRKLRRRGEWLAREHLDQLARSERLAAEALRAWVAGRARMPTSGWSAYARSSTSSAPAGAPWARRGCRAPLARVPAGA